ncbi:pyridine nucleotide-disulfide oxidoreductase [Nocardioides sp.]|uniref:pyridine nucleotide-disulfide oxidoreductase n=1 Tax=Nocardioides sp. TaxID=35761 RepID=UPI002D7EB95B|nr:pyridine nucleotide-disulfide oxidoreductase [Nocardioides sp.]HET8960434.1 pyridine nucleotide-disulfide oxidoreductase [Nocardioides sp.]
MLGRDLYGYALSTGPEAEAAYVRGVRDLLCLRAGAVEAAAESIAHDPHFALGHAALALLGHELCAPVDVEARLRDAALHSVRGTARERSHVQAISAHVCGDSRPLVAHLVAYPRDALLLSVAVPTIAFAGVTEVPEEAWSIVERAAPAYGDDWWFGGLLGFIRQEQRRFDEAMELACRSLAEEPAAGHSAHARAHAHYETGDHAGGLSWMDQWLAGEGAEAQSLTHFAWHAALHELSLGDLDAVRRRYDAQLLPEAGLGCRALVDSGSLLFRWAITPGATDVPDLAAVAAATDREILERPATPFVAMHAAVVQLALGDRAGLATLTRWAADHAHPVHREVVAPLGTALLQMADGRCSEAADALAALDRACPRLGGSDAQREILEETRICALLRADRYDDARRVLDDRLDRRRSPRDLRWRDECRPRTGTVRPG